jgi:hypothetical protein
MRKLKKVCFFCSVQKCEQETQATFSDPPISADSLIGRSRSGDIEAILLQEVHFLTPGTPVLIDGYNPRVSFYSSAMSHPSFDILTPPPELFQCLSTVTFELFDNLLTISRPGGESRHFPDKPLDPLLRLFENGILNSELAFELAKMKCRFENGFIIGKCVDHRFSPARQTNIKLDIGPDIVAAAFRQCQEPLETEKEVLMIQRPAVCTDTSPDVARLQSIMDFRKKMWQRREQGVREKENGFVENWEYVGAATKCQSVRINESRARFSVPEELKKLCARECGIGIE